MPKRQPQGNAQLNIASGSTVLFDTFTIVNALGTLNTDPVFGQGLPILTSWFLQTAGAVGATVQLQFAHGQAAGAPDFQPLIPPFVLALNVPDRRDTRMAAYFYRAIITAPAQNGVTFRWWLAASAS